MVFLSRIWRWLAHFTVGSAFPLSQLSFVLSAVATLPEERFTWAAHLSLEGLTVLDQAVPEFCRSDVEIIDDNVNSLVELLKVRSSGMRKAQLSRDHFALHEFSAPPPILSGIFFNNFSSPGSAFSALACLGGSGLPSCLLGPEASQMLDFLNQGGGSASPSLFHLQVAAKEFFEVSAVPIYLFGAGLPVSPFDLAAWMSFSRRYTASPSNASSERPHLPLATVRCWPVSCPELQAPR